MNDGERVVLYKIMPIMNEHRVVGETRHSYWSFFYSVKNQPLIKSSTSIQDPRIGHYLQTRYKSCLTLVARPVCITWGNQSH